jgi:hypothetical protein
MNSEQKPLLERCSSAQLISIIEMIPGSDVIDFERAIRMVQQTILSEGFLKEDLYHIGEDYFLGTLEELKAHQEKRYSQPYLAKGTRFVYVKNRGWSSQTLGDHLIEGMDRAWAEKWLDNIRVL